MDIRVLDNFRHDILYALRAMRKSPAFSVAAVCTLALGIGGNTAMFTVIRTVLLKPLEYRDPDRLVYLSTANPQRNIEDGNIQLQRIEELRTASRSFTALGAYGANLENITLSGDGEPEALRGARVSANFLDILGVQPVLGRGFRPEEDASGGPPVAMISSDLWKRRFAGDPAVIGKTATLDSTPHAIIGVLPPGFEFPFRGVDIWFTRPSEWSALPSRFWRIPLLKGFGRLKANVSLEQARAEMDVIGQAYLRAHPGPDLGMIRIVWLKDRLVRNVRLMLWMLFAAMGFVLLIACANVASLLLARATSRSREFAVRAALGAGRGRLIHQLLAESLLLSVAGGVLGTLLAKWGLSAFRALDVLHIAGAGTIRLDSIVLAFTVALSLATGVLFGLIPSLQISRPNLADVLRETGAAAGQASSGRRSALGVSPRALLVVGQIALSIVLLIGAALLMQSFVRVQSVDPGFQPANLLTMKIALPPVRYNTDPKKSAFFADLVERVESMPGVRSATVTMSLPTTTWIRTNITKIQGRPELDARDPLFAVIESVTPGYFAALRIPLRRGREFTAHDNTPGAPPTIIVNENLARRLWPGYPHGIDPIGQHIGEGYDKAIPWFEVVGVTADTHEGGLASDAVPEFYIPCVLHPPQSAYLAVRTVADPLSVVASVRRQLRAIDPDQSVSEVRTMESILEATLGQRRLTMLLLGSFAGIALLLAMIGIYGVIACSVVQRTQEVGIRRALGAQQADILKLVLRQGLYVALAGIAIGVGGAFALTRTMRTLLFQVDATDPATFAIIAVLFVVVALAASFLPAARASRIDPMTALRIG